MAALDQVTSMLPSVSGASIVNIITYLLLLFVGVVIMGIVIYIILIRVKYKSKAEIWTDLGNGMERVKTFRARPIKWSKDGSEVFYIRGIKKYVAMPELRTGRNTFCFWKNKQGDLINWQPPNFDEKAKEMKIFFAHQDARLAKASMEDFFEKRYDTKGFLERFGGIIVSIVAITIILVFVFLIVDRFLEYAGTMESAVSTMAQLQETNLQVLGAIDNICSGSGLTKT